MDIREEINHSNYYWERLKQIQNTFCNGVQDLILIHYNSFIKKYGGWPKYPRKIKKRLKKTTLWTLRHRTEIFTKEDFNVVMR